jgi:hypothetical protein
LQKYRLYLNKHQQEQEQALMVVESNSSHAAAHAAVLKSSQWSHNSHVAEQQYPMAYGCSSQQVPRKLIPRHFPHQPNTNLHHGYATWEQQFPSEYYITDHDHAVGLGNLMANNSNALPQQQEHHNPQQSPMHVPQMNNAVNDVVPSADNIVEVNNTVTDFGEATMQVEVGPQVQELGRVVAGPQDQELGRVVVGPQAQPQELGRMAAGPQAQELGKVVAARQAQHQELGRVVAGPQAQPQELGRVVTGPQAQELGRVVAAPHAQPQELGRVVAGPQAPQAQAQELGRVVATPQAQPQELGRGKRYKKPNTRYTN